MNIIEFDIPALLFVFASVVSTVKNSSSQNRSILFYAIILGSYWCALLAPIRICMLVFEDMHYGFFMSLNMMANCITILNPILYCYFDRVFYKQAQQFLHLTYEEDVQMIRETSKIDDMA
jgi:hypothetical protein